MGSLQTASAAGPRRLLIVDDEEAIRRALERIFRADYDVATAQDGAEALALARRFAPHAVISDQSMPRMTGVELLAQLRAEMPDTVRILVTGYTDYSSLVEAVNAAHVHHYCEKPFVGAELKALVDSLLTAQAAAAERERLLTALRAAVRDLEASNAALLQREGALRAQPPAAATVPSGADTLQLSGLVAQATHASAQLADAAHAAEISAVRPFAAVVARAQQALAGTAAPGALAMASLDALDGLRARGGQAAADALVSACVALLGAPGAGPRLVARYGSGRICLWLPATDAAEARAAAAAACATVAAWRPLAPPTTTLSLGVAWPGAPAPADVAAWLQAADTAREQAVAQGGDRAVAAGP